MFFQGESGSTAPIWRHPEVVAGTKSASGRRSKRKNPLVHKGFLRFTSEGGRLPGRPRPLVRRDLGVVGQSERDVVQTLEESPSRVVVDVEGVLDRVRAITRADRAGMEIDADRRPRLGLEQVPQSLHDLVVDLCSQQAGVAGVAPEDVAEAWGDDDPETVVLHGPDRVLARRAGAEVRACYEHRAHVVRRVVEHERRVAAPGREQSVLETGARDALEVDGRDDLVGVDVATAQRYADAGVRGEGVHHWSPDVVVSTCSTADVSRSDGELRVPRTAVAAATGPETRGGRPPLPWRPSKLRLEVEALRSCGASWSGFMPRHIEHPAPRHSAPASLHTTSRPSSSAWSRTRTDPGTTSSRVPGATVLPFRTF